MQGNQLLRTVSRIGCSARSAAIMALSQEAYVVSWDGVEDDSQDSGLGSLPGA